MARRRLGGQQISALLESLPGIASVLRSPVADAIVGMIRAGSGLGDFREADAKELVQYAVRRSLLGSQEGEDLLVEVKQAVKQLRAAKRAAKKSPAGKKVARKPAAKAAKKKAVAKSAKAGKTTTKTTKTKQVAKIRTRGTKGRKR